MNQNLCLELSGILISLFINLNYFSVKRRNTIIHRVFSGVLIVSALNLIIDFANVWIVENKGYPLDIFSRLYMISLTAVVAMIFTYCMSAIMNEGGKVFLEKTSLWHTPLAIYAIAMLLVPNKFTKVGNLYIAGTIPLSLTFGTVAIYIVGVIYELIRNWQKLSLKVKSMMSLSVGLLLAAFVFQAINNKVSITGFGVILICVCLYLVNENPDSLIIEKLQFEKDRADSANKSKSSFIAHVSHEIRTPINAILGMNEMIIRESKEDSIKQYAQDISGAAYALYGIINDVLDMSKIDSGKMDIIPVNYELNQMIYDTISFVQPKIDAKQLDFFVEVAPGLPRGYYGDDIRIRQVLINLLSNAVKYTHEGFVRFVVTGDYHGEYVDLNFQIRDTGIGIKEEDIQRLFIAFERIEESRNRNIEGTGLGMNISNNLLKMMGSRLKVSSVYGEGTIFSFVLTQRVTNSEPVGDFGEYTRIHKETAQTAFKAPSAKILVVDDNVLNRRVFSSLLNNTEMQIDEAESGYECLEKIKLEPYDIIFLDHQMPGMDGVETIGRIKSEKEHVNRKTPVIMLTANAVAEHQGIYMNAGFDACLSKPIFLEELEKIIKAYLPSYKIMTENVEPKPVAENANWREQLPVIRGIDWMEATKHLPTREVLFATLNEFRRSIDSESKIFDECIADIDNEDNLEMLRIKAHALKGAAAMIGAEMLSEGAKDIEIAAREHDIQGIREKYPYMINYYRTFKDRLKEFDSGTEEKRTDIDFPQVIALTEMVRLEMLDMNKANAIDALDELSVYKYPDEIETNYVKLRNAVEDFNSELVDLLVDDTLIKLRMIRE